MAALVLPRPCAHLYDHGVHWQLVALTVGFALVGVVTFGSLAGSMPPFAATLVDVTGLMLYFTVALVVLRGTLL